MSLDINLRVELTCNAYNQLVRNKSRVYLKENGKPLLEIDMNSFIANHIESFYEIRENNGSLQWFRKNDRITSSNDYFTTIKTNNRDLFNALKAEFSLSDKVAEFAKTIVPVWENKEEYRPKNPVTVPRCVTFELDYVNNVWSLSMRLLSDEVSK